MARNHFAIEKPRKISIAIEGYDAKARIQAQQKKQFERNRRLQRKPRGAAAPGTAALAPEPDLRTSNPAAPPSAPKTVCTQEDEVEALGAAASSTPEAQKAEQDLRAAFGLPRKKGGTNANE